MSDAWRSFRPRLIFSRGSGAPVAALPAAPLPVTDLDRERFRLVMLPHLDAAYTFARYLARDPTAAEDIVQDSFLRAFQSFAACRGNEKAWLFAIVRNCFLDWLKRNGRPSADFAADVGGVDADHPEAIVQRCHDVAAVRATVASLPEPFREALVLRDLEELSYRDIATLTHVPIGTVMSRLARARQMLAVLLLAGEKGAL